MKIDKPSENEYGVFYKNYIDKLNEKPVEFLKNQQSRINDILKNINEEKLLYRYADGKWSIKELMVHCIDTERIMSYRLLSLLRGETKELMGFDENLYAENSNADKRDMQNIMNEFNALRTSTIALIESIQNETDLMRSGIANNNPISVRALIYIIPGHFEHHLNVLISKYLN